MPLFFTWRGIFKKLEIMEDFMYVWFDANKREFSEPFSQEDVDKYLDEEIIKKAEDKNWSLVKYKSMNNVEVKFN